MGIKLHILFLVTIFLNLSAFADEKFLNIKGTVLEEESKTAVTGYSVKVVQDRLDSTTTAFSKSEFQVWAPANRRTTLYFMKEGYVTKLVYIDASYIPSIAFKEKQEIELEILMTPVEKVGRRNFSKPIMTAQYNAKCKFLFCHRQKFRKITIRHFQHRLIPIKEFSQAQMIWL
ncbi:MAG: hypothetical protein IPO32_02910 [Crocinitomicaceae bacterium]|nr:hypothetical protein [Crocinitomicaceae bacterium]